LDSACRVRIRDILQPVVSRVNISNCPFHGLTRPFRVLIEAEVNHTTDSNIRIVKLGTSLLIFFSSRRDVSGDIIIAGPYGPDDQLLVAVLARGLASHASKLYVLVKLSFTRYVSVDAELKVASRIHKEELLSYI
jgi:hypothetical protein